MNGDKFLECAPFYRMARILGIPRLRSAFYRMRRLLECAEHIHIQFTYSALVYISNEKTLPFIHLHVTYIHIFNSYVHVHSLSTYMYVHVSNVRFLHKYTYVFHVHVFFNEQNANWQYIIFMEKAFTIGQCLFDKKDFEGSIV